MIPRFITWKKSHKGQVDMGCFHLCMRVWWWSSRSWWYSFAVVLVVKCIYSTHRVNANDLLLQLSPVKVSAYLFVQWIVVQTSKERKRERGRQSNYILTTLAISAYYRHQRNTRILTFITVRNALYEPPILFYSNSLYSSQQAQKGNYSVSRNGMWGFLFPSSSIEIACIYFIESACVFSMFLYICISHLHTSPAWNAHK